ncbi:MAG: hypothetical protein Q9190_006840 [Brigantiaea leucoxantha]
MYEILFHAGCYVSDIPRYRSITPKARLIPLTDPFIEYLKSDGIMLPAEEDEIQTSISDTDSGIFSSNSSSTGYDSDDDLPDPSLAWPEIHQQIKSTIAELGGSVTPKLNWSAPKDATWINATNSMECCTPNDVYLLLKSSDFVTHDLEQAFDGCDDPNGLSDPQELEKVPYHLALRKNITALVNSLEFRCFVRSRQLICMCQRDLNHYDFLRAMIPLLRPLIHNFFEKQLKSTFPDENFVFDVYIPPPHQRVWLIDINPWAPRTDPLLFSWMEVLNLDCQPPQNDRENNDSNIEIEQGIEEVFTPEFRLVNRDDPEAYGFTSPQFSAHKLPKDVVDASGAGEAGLRDFMGQWRDIIRRQENDEST